MNKSTLWRILEASDHRDRASTTVDAFIIGLILCNVLCVILESVPEYHAAYPKFFLYFEIFSTIIFCIEYLLRLWSCTASKEYSSSLRGRLKYAITPMALIDLIAILPTLLLMASVDLRTLRIFRVFRFLRIVKLGRYMQALKLFQIIIGRHREELVITSVLMSFLLVITSSLMYFAEHEAQPEQFSSIPAAMWWSVATLTTVGYGDIYPVTPLGRLLGAFSAIFGIGLFALPTGILGAGFVEAIQQKRKHPPSCPHCGKELT